MKKRVEEGKFVASPEPTKRTSSMFQEAEIIFKELNDEGQKAAIAMLKGLALQEKFKTK